MEKEKRRKTGWIITGMLVAVCLLVLAVWWGKHQTAVQENTSTGAANEIEETTREAESEDYSDTEEERTVINDASKGTPFGYVGYTGYMNECLEWSDYQNFANQDYDGDGQTERVYRTECENGQGSCLYQIEFGNGTILKMEKETMGSIPAIEVADLNGDGENEIIFFGSYGFSTNPMANGDFVIFEKKNGSYQEAVLPFTEAGDGYQQNLTFQYEKAEPQSLKVTCKESPFWCVVPIDDETWTGFRYEENYPGQTYQAPVWNIVLKAADGQTKIICEIALFDKWSMEEVQATLGYQNGGYAIEEMKQGTAYSWDENSGLN